MKYSALFIVVLLLAPMAAEGFGGNCAAPPTPDPSTFSSVPTAVSATSISMTSTTGTPSAHCSLYYDFGYHACGTNDGTGGTSVYGQQLSVSYTNSGLQPNECYSYQVQMYNDEAANVFYAASSTSASTYTLANTPGAPTLSSPSATTLALTNDENGNPASNPTTDFAVQITVTSGTDATWNNMWVDGSGNPSATPVWLSDAQLDGLVLTGLTSSTTYAAASKAENFNSVATSLSSAGSNTTSAGSVGPTRIIRLRGGLRLRGGVRIL